MNRHKKICTVYDILRKAYGPQGWWPILFTRNSGEKSSHFNGYHPGDYDYPKNGLQQLEICLGAVLTQNTNWKNVLLALGSLASSGLLSLERLLEAKNDQIALAIKSAGYYNQKAGYIKNLVLFLDDFPFDKLKRYSKDATRQKLLEIKGIGPETADSILLYSLKKNSFVVDAYTTRILSCLGIISPKLNYGSIQELFESSLKNDLIVFQEYHALLVQHGKEYYSRKPYGKNDRLLLKDN